MSKSKYLNSEYVTNEGKRVVVIDYIKYSNCTIKFEDGTILYNIGLGNLINGEVKYPFSYKGMVFRTKQGYEVTVIDYINSLNLTIQFNDAKKTILKNIPIGNLKKGAVNNPYHPTLFNIGFIGEGIYKSCEFVDNLLKSTKYYVLWGSMFARCYGGKNPSYKDVTVCEEWHNFQNFAQWFEENWKPWMDSSWQLDKDIICSDCKIYSPETCCFVPKQLNCFYLINTKKKNNLPIGTWLRKDGKFIAEISKNCKKEKLGIFNTPEEAFQAYKTAKEEYAKHLANEWRDKIDPRVYEAIHEYKI